MTRALAGIDTYVGLRLLDRTALTANITALKEAFGLRKLAPDMGA